MTTTLSTARRHPISHARVGLGLVTVALLAGAACSPADGPAQQTHEAPSTADAGAVPSLTPPVGGPTYRHVEKLCRVLDVSALQSFGPVGNQQDEVRQAGADTSNMTCAMNVGGLPDGVVMVVMATVGGPASGQLLYEGLRGVQEDAGPVTDVSGLGAAAYTYRDELAATHVVTYDNNLYLTVMVAPLGFGVDMPRDLVDRLTRVAGTALSGLRS